jgi:molybdopterin converting factor small subunit
MNFLIVYDPATGVSEVTEYQDDATADALKDRLKAEISALERNVTREIVVLNAKNVDDLRETHARYFGDTTLRREVTRLLGSPPAA